MDSSEVNTKAFLKLIIYAENKRDDDSVYYQLFGGKHQFSDTTKHPNVPTPIHGGSDFTTAAGAYQITNTTWRDAVANGKVTHFAPRDQDTIARWKLEQHNTLPYVQKGDIEHAIPHLNHEWTALPGSRYATMTMTEARQRYDKYVSQLNSGK
jgi:muramidase (phage lysozyme)